MLPKALDVGSLPLPPPEPFQPFPPACSSATGRTTDQAKTKANKTATDCSPDLETPAVATEPTTELTTDLATMDSGIRCVKDGASSSGTGLVPAPPTDLETDSESGPATGLARGVAMDFVPNSASDMTITAGTDSTDGSAPMSADNMGSGISLGEVTPDRDFSQGEYASEVDGDGDISRSGDVDLSFLLGTFAVLHRDGNLDKAANVLEVALEMLERRHRLRFSLERSGSDRDSLGGGVGANDRAEEEKASVVAMTAVMNDLGCTYQQVENVAWSLCANAIRVISPATLECRFLACLRP